MAKKTHRCLTGGELADVLVASGERPVNCRIRNKAAQSVVFVRIDKSAETGADVIHLSLGSIFSPRAYNAKEILEKVKGFQKLCVEMLEADGSIKELVEVRRYQKSVTLYYRE